MMKYVIKRSLQSLITIFIIVSVCFITMQTSPMTGMGKDSNPSIPVLLNRLYYFWFDLIFNGSFGNTRLYVGYTVMSVIVRRGKYSLVLSLWITFISYVLGMYLGVLYTRQRGKLLDIIGHFYYSVVSAIPEIIIYLLFQINFTWKIGLPIIFKKRLMISWLIPIIAGCFVLFPKVAISMRRYITDQLNTDYTRFARAKGLSEKMIFRKHIFKNILVFLSRDIITTLYSIITTTLFLEWIFSIPGLADLLFNAIKLQDSPLVQGVVTIFTIVSVIGIFVSDILVTIIDPRIEIN